VDDVRVAEPAHQRRQVDQLRHCGPHVFHTLKDAQGPWSLRVDWQQRCADVGIALPAAQEPVGLDRLAPEDPQRGRHQDYVKALSY
jgi:hypothetical protein